MMGNTATIISSCYLILILAATTSQAAKSNTTNSSNKPPGRVAFMKLPGSTSYIPIFVHDLATSPAETSYQYKPPRNGYTYPKPPTPKVRPTARTTPAPVPEIPDESEEDIQAAGIPVGPKPGKEAELPPKYKPLGQESEEDIQAAGIIPDEFPFPGVFDTPQFETNLDDPCASNLECVYGEPIPGIPGIDYPIYSEAPRTNFRCPLLSGYYGDTQARCQAFHVCLKTREKVRQYSFLCPNGTVFSQNDFVCVWWHDFKCEATPSLYHLNKQLHWDDSTVSLKQKMNNLKNMVKLQGNTRINPLNFPQQLLPALSIRLPDSRQTFGVLQREHLKQRPDVTKVTQGKSKTVYRQYSSGSEAYENNDDASGFIVNKGHPKQPGSTYQPFLDNETPGTVHLGSHEDEEDIQAGGSYPSPPPYVQPRPRTTRPPKTYYPQPASPDEGEEDVQPGGSFPTTTAPPRYVRPRPRVTQPPLPNDAESADENEEDVQPGGSFPTTTPQPKYKPRPRTTTQPPLPNDAESADENEEDVQPGGSLPTTTPAPKSKPRTTQPSKKYVPPRPAPTEPTSEIGFNTPDEEESDIQPGGQPEPPIFVTPRPQIPKQKLNYLPPVVQHPPPPGGYSNFPSFQLLDPNFFGQGQPNYVPVGTGGYEQTYALPLSSQERVFYSKQGQPAENQYDQVAIFLPRDSNVIPARSPVVSLQKDILQNGIIPALGPIEPIRAVSYSFPPPPNPLSQDLQLAQAQFQQSPFDYGGYQSRLQRESSSQSQNNQKPAMTPASKPETQQNQNRKQGKLQAIPPAQNRRQGLQQSALRVQPSRVNSRGSWQQTRSQRLEDPMQAEGASMSVTRLLGPMLAGSTIEPPVRSIELEMKSRQGTAGQLTNPTRRPLQIRTTPQSPPPEPIRTIDILNSNEVIDNDALPASQSYPVTLFNPEPNPTHIPVSYQPFQEPTFDYVGSDGRVPVTFPRQLRDILLPEVDEPPELIRAHEAFAQTYISREEPPQSPPPPPPPPPPRKIKKPLPLKHVHPTHHHRPPPHHKKHSIKNHGRGQGKRHRFYLDFTKYDSKY